MTRIGIREVLGNEQVIRFIIERVRRTNKRKRIVVLRFRQWFQNHTWSKYFLDSNAEYMHDPTKRLAKIFRRRFRVPWPLFQDVLVPLVKQR